MTPRNLSLAVALCLLAAPLSAQMDGHDLQAVWYYPSFGAALETHLITVGPGVELTDTDIVNDFKYSIDVSGDLVTFSFNNTSNWSVVSFNGWWFEDVAGTLPPITGYAVDSTSAGVSGPIVTGFDSDHFWANFAGVSVAGNGDWIKLRVTFDTPVLTITNLVAGQVATATVDNVTANGQVGIAWSATGSGPTTVNAGSCGATVMDLSPPIHLLGILTASGTTATTSGLVPPGAVGLTLYVQALDLGSCTPSNLVVATVL